MKTTLLLCVAVVAQPDSRGRRFQPEPTYSPETPFRDNVPAPVFGAGHNRSPFSPSRYWGQEELQRYHAPWESARGPFGNFGRGPGRDLGEEDGRGSGATSGRDQQGPAKVVGVNMQMVAGMYPDGRYSPLSGPYEEDRRENPSEKRTFGSRNRGPPFRQGPFRDPESGSPHQRNFFGPKPVSRESDHYEPDSRRYLEFDGRGRRHEDYERQSKYKPTEGEIDGGFRDSDKGGRFHMGAKRPNDERDLEPEDMGRFRNFHREEDRDSRPQDRRQPNDRREFERNHSREEEDEDNHLVEGDAGITVKGDVDKRTTLPEEPLSEITAFPTPASANTTIHE